MRPVVIGGAGYLGSVLWFPTKVFDKAKGDDMMDEAQLARAFKGVNEVVHLAALGDAQCNRDPEAARIVNVEGTRMIVEAAERSGVERLVFASSCSVYGWQEGLLDESSPLSPTSIYGKTKAAAESIVLKSKIPKKAVLRFAALFGHSPAMRFDTLFNQLVFDAVHSGEMRIFEPDAWRPLLHVKDAARAIRNALFLPRDNEVVNMACGNYRKREIAAMISDWRPATKVIFEKEKEDSRSYRVDFSKMDNLIGRATHYPSDALGEIA